MTDLPEELSRPRPTDTHNALAWVDEPLTRLPADPAERMHRLVTLLVAELGKGRGAVNPHLIAVLRERLGWPDPGSSDAEVLETAARRGRIPQTVATLESWPPALQRTGLIAELRRRHALVASS